MLIIGIGPGCFLYGFVTSGYNAGMRGGKQSMYEGGHRVPCFIRWPDGQIGSRPGRDVEQLTAHFDLFPTLIDLCNLNGAENIRFDGTSLVPLLRQKPVPWPERKLVVAVNREEDPPRWRRTAVLTERWRLVNGQELYDIAADPEIYHEKYRPQFHFTAQKNWINDPNGLVYYNGEYHLFFQHNPFDIHWGNMTWGHAVSTDLVHWKQLPNAVEPDELGTIFSGSAVVDWNNTSGFQTGKENVLVAFYTSAGKHARVPRPFTQSIAYSNDCGRTWVKYKHNPVIGHIRAENRDPKVIWHAPTQAWIMALYLDADDFLLLSSKDIKHWTPLQEIKLAGSDECPDFFELPVDGDLGNARWVFWGGDGRYMLGTFDGRTFTPQTDSIQSKVGTYSAAQTWSDIPESDGRRIQIGWTKGSFPGMPFNQQLSVPCELTLRTFGEGIRLCRVPARETKRLRRKRYTWSRTTIKPGENLLSGVAAELFEIQSEIELAGASEAGFILRGTPLVYNVADKTLSCKDVKANLSPVSDRINLHILVDRTSIEVFANNGRLSIFLSFPLDTDNTALELLVRGGRATLTSLDIWKLASIWLRG